VAIDGDHASDKVRWPCKSVKGEYLALGTNDSNVASGPGVLPPPQFTEPQRFNWLHDIPIVHTAKIGIN
jgi:hypothetical protein